MQYSTPGNRAKHVAVEVGPSAFLKPPAAEVVHEPAKDTRKVLVSKLFFVHWYFILRKAKASLLPAN